MSRCAAAPVAWPRPTIVSSANSAATRAEKSSGAKVRVEPRLSANSLASWVSSEYCPKSNGPRRYGGGSWLEKASLAKAAHTSGSWPSTRKPRASPSACTISDPARRSWASCAGGSGDLLMRLSILNCGGDAENSLQLCSVVHAVATRRSVAIASRDRGSRVLDRRRSHRPMWERNAQGRLSLSRVTEERQGHFSHEEQRVSLMCTPGSSQATAALCRNVCTPTFSTPALSAAISIVLKTLRG
jgi:hypothetical protein